LLAGRTPRVGRDGLTVADLCNHFLTSKQRLLDAGEITRRTWNDHKATCDRIVPHFGKHRLVEDLASADFEALRASIAKTRGPMSLGNEIQRVRVIFKYAYDAELIARPVRYGPQFRRPSKKVMRLDRAKKGAKMFEAPDLLRLLNSASVHMRAMIYLGLNCGFGNSDVGTLPLAALDLDGGWLNYHRPKTGIDRRCKLWPETVEALKAALTRRPTPRVSEAESLVFVTKYGAPWAKETVDNPVTKEFRKLLEGLRLHRNGIGFYTLRHIFRTIAGGARDLEATRAIMGHTSGHVEEGYIEGFEDARLSAVAEYVRQWLFVNSPNDGAAKAGDQVVTPAKGKINAITGKVKARAVGESLLRIVG